MEDSVTPRVRALDAYGGDPHRTAEIVSEVMAPATGVRLPSRPRQHWMDVLRGAAIVMVVLTHVRAQGHRLFGIDEMPLNLLVDVVAPVRIPLLMLLSGMLLSRSLAKGPRAFVVGKLRGIAWPYVVWSLVFLGVWRLFPGIDGGVHTAGLQDIATAPVSVLWYLHLLLGLYLLALLLSSIPGVRPVHLVSLAALGWALASLGASYDLERALCLATAFLAGDLLARRLESGLPAALTRTWTSPGRRPWTLLALLATASPLLWWAIERQPVRYMPPSLLPVLAAMVLLALAAHAVRGWRVERVLAWVGRQSLVFYVAHWLLVGAWFAAVAHVVDPVALPYPATALVLLGTLTTCAALARLQQRSRPVGWLFAAPRRDAGSARVRSRVQG